MRICGWNIQDHDYYTKERVKNYREYNILKKDTPEALHSMLSEKDNREEAKNKYISRKAKATVLCPPTCSGVYLQSY